MRCPGQDTRFWTPDDVFEVLCQNCGVPVEFFKDDAFRRCTRCGKRIQNPKVSLGCALWCDYAKVCLGYDPEAIGFSNPEELSLIDKLIEAVKKEFGDNQKGITRALLVLDHAQELLRTEIGDPRVVMAAALLLDISQRGTESPMIARRIAKDTGSDQATIEHICRIVAGCHGMGDIDTPEFKIVWDADRLVEMLDESSYSSDKSKGIIEKAFRTETGKRIAQRGSETSH